LFAFEEDDPTIAVAEPRAVPGCSQGMKLDARLVAFDDEVLRAKLSPLWKHPG
jgi:hypothetical protein